MEQGVWQEIEQLYQKFQQLGISEAVDYEKYYLYSLITHSTAIEGSGSVVILGGLSLVNSLHAYTFASLKRKKLISTTPLNDALNALILALNASAAAFVLLFTKKFRILS